MQAERLVATLEDHAFIYRGTLREEVASLALARLQASHGGLLAALSILDAKAAEEPENAARWRGIASEAVRSASEVADPVARPGDFEAALAALRFLDKSPASDAARLTLSRKLMEAGGAHLMEDALSSAMLKRSPDARRLLAEARLRKGDARGARALLATLRDEESDALRQRASEIEGAPARDDAKARFGPVTALPGEASLSGARALLEETDTDLLIVKELLSDG
jgi:hypothetical protein